MNKGLSIKRWAVTYVEYGDSADGKARILGLFASPLTAEEAMRTSAERYKESFNLDHIEVYNDSASVGDTAECGCEYKIGVVEIPLLPTDYDVWVH